MQTVLQILKMAGGWSLGLALKVENPPHSTLFIDAMDESGPCALPALSVAQYTNALAMPEMSFELGLQGGAHLDPFHYRNDYIGVEQWSRTILRGHYVYLYDLHEQQERIAKRWDNNLRVQGFMEAFARQRQTPRA